MENDMPKCLPFEGEEKEEQKKYLPVHTNGFVKVGEKKWVLTYNFIKKGPALCNMKPRQDDTWVFSYPRSGTTLTVELVWLVANDMNFEGAKNRSLNYRFPFVDLDMLVSHYYKPTEDNTVGGADVRLFNPEYVDALSSPRFIKTHIPFDLMPNILKSGCKVIYVARNPKDTVVSWYNFYRDISVHQYQGNFEQFCEFFMRDLCLYSPYWTHLKDAWAERHRPNFLYIFYEELQNNMRDAIKKIENFFGKSYSDDQIDKLIDHLRIDNFRQNTMVNLPWPRERDNIEPSLFVRMGKVGGWKETFNPKLEAKFDAWIQENLKDTDLVFPLHVVQEK